MTHQELAEKLCNFTNDFLKSDFFNEEDEIFIRTFINRLYYALYHKLIYSINTTLSGPGIHDTIEKILQKNSSNPHIEKVYLQFTKLKSLRVWADYKTEEKQNINLKYLQYNTYRIIKQNLSL